MNFEQLTEHVKKHVLPLMADVQDRQDADPGIALSRQLEYVKQQTFDVEYPILKARRFLPVSNEAPSDAESILHRQWSQYGSARLMTSLTDDLPLGAVAQQEFSTPVKSLGAAYHYDVQELKAAGRFDRPLDAARAQAQMRGFEVKVDDIAAFGDSSVGLAGFLNNSNVPVVSLDNGSWTTGSSPQEILEDLYQFEESIYDATEENHAPNTMLLSNAQFKHVRTTQMTTSGENTDTILQTFLRNAQYVTSVDRWKKLEKADAGGTGPRHVCYERSPMVLTLEIPQEVETFAPQQVNLYFKVPMHMRIGGVRMTYPKAVAYADND